jgi:hypothetical protein
MLLDFLLPYKSSCLIRDWDENIPWWGIVILYTLVGYVTRGILKKYNKSCRSSYDFLRDIERKEKI